MIILDKKYWKVSKVWKMRAKTFETHCATTVLTFQTQTLGATGVWIRMRREPQSLDMSGTSTRAKWAGTVALSSNLLLGLIEEIAAETHSAAKHTHTHKHFKAEYFIPYQVDLFLSSLDGRRTSKNRAFKKALWHLIGKDKRSLS